MQQNPHKLPIAANLLQRNFTAAAPNQVWTGDTTYLATDEGWLYLAVVLDLFSRQVVGWSMQPHMQSLLVTDALRMAWFRRAPDKGVIFHSDRGSQLEFKESSQHQFLKPRILIHSAPQLVFSSLASCAACHSG